jgi:3-oxoacyl-[acyl-carrier-protein] synthase-3
MIRQVKIISTGAFVPETVVSNADLVKNIDSNDEWIRSNLGIKERRRVRNGQCTSDLAANAAICALKNANLSALQLDMIIVATATPDRIAPSTAAIVQDKIKAYNAVAFDISAVCSGFLYAMSIANQYIANNVYNKILVIGADTFSTITDWTRRDAVFFGDGAGAVILSHAGKDEGFLAYRLYSDGRGKFEFTVPAGGSEIPTTNDSIQKNLHTFQMNGRAVYETATKVLPIAINQVLLDCNMKIDDIDLMVPHQPSIKILQKTAELIGMPFEKVMTNMDKYANTSGATIPLILHETYTAGKIKIGSKILFAAVGSGWTYGASILKWA